MPKSDASLSDVKEEVYSTGLVLLTRAAIVAVCAGVLFAIAHVLNTFNQHQPAGVFRGFGIAAILIAACVAAVGAYRMTRPRKLATFDAQCPYCDHPAHLLAEPSTGFTCEECHRLVQYENGVMVPVHTVECAFCKTEHRVCDKTTSYRCENCNRPLRLRPTDAEPVSDDSELLQNYDVIITDVGRRRDEVAMELVSILVCNLREARQRLESIPADIVHGVPQRRAESFRRRLQEKGATAVMRPAATQAAPTTRR